MERIIRKATIADLPVVLRLIRSGREIMCENGNPNQWGDNHPTTSQLEAETVKCEDETVVTTLRAVLCPALRIVVSRHRIDRQPEPAREKEEVLLDHAR